MKIGIINYGIGNLGSIQNMGRRIGLEMELVSDPENLDSYEELILPGIGHFKAAIDALRECGFEAPLREWVTDPSRRLLGICVGMQMLFDHGEEGNVSGLSFLPGRVKRFDLSSMDLKVPHMGWNQVDFKSGFEEMEEWRFYFAHSFHADCSSDLIIGSVDYGIQVPSFVGRDNIFGAQFHPEKSHKFGMKFFESFYGGKG